MILTLSGFKRLYPLIYGALSQVQMVWFGLFFACSVYPQHQIAEEPGVAAALQLLDAWFDGVVRQRPLPSLSVAIVHDQEIIWEKVYGNARQGALYPFGGGYRTFDALALLQLRAEGKLSLDDPVDKHLPWFRIKNPGGPALTIRHLMLNTTGLPRHVPGTNLNDLTVPSRAEMIRHAGETVAISPPGSKVAFSHLGGALAHEIISVLSGQPYATYMERHVFAPIGMRDTCILPCSSRMPSSGAVWLQGYDRLLAGTRRRAEPLPSPSPVTNTRDLSSFASAFFRASSSGGPLAELQQGEAPRPNGSTWTYGFGSSKPGNTGHLVSSGYMNGFQTFLSMIPSQKLAVIVLANAADTPVDDYVDLSLAIAGPAIQRAAAADSPVLYDPAWSKYTGAYRWKDSRIYVQALNGELSIFWLENTALLQTRTTLTPVGPHTFKMFGFNRQEAPEGELLIFDFDEAGRTTKTRAPSMYWLREAK